MLLLVVQRVVESLQRVAHDLHGLDHGIEPRLGGIKPRHRRQRNGGRARSFHRLLCLERGGLQFIENRELIAGRPHGLFDLLDRQVGHARRQAVAAFHRRGVGFRERLAILLGHIEAAGRSAAVIDLAAARIVRGAGHVAIVRRVAIVRAEIGSGRKDADKHEIGAIHPERIVIIIRPEREAEDVAVEIRPEDRAGPAAPAAAPAVPAGAPEMAAPAIPVPRVAEGVPVEARLIEIVQAVEIVRGELIVRELRMRHGGST